MALTTALRNRIVGFLIILSLLLIALPALLNTRPQHRAPDSVAVSSHGAVTDESGNLMAPPDDYAALLAPEDDSKEGLISENSELMADALQAAAQSETGLKSAEPAVSPVEELSYGSPSLSARQTESQRADTEILVAPGRDLTKRPSLTASVSKPASQSTPDTSDSGVTGKPVAGRFTVQVGVFSQKANASRVMATLEKAGIHCLDVTVNANGKELIRVYAGNSGSREALNGLVSRIESLAKVRGRIVSL